MSSIEDAIEQLEDSAKKLRKLSVEESKAIRDAVRKASNDATARVKSEYATQKKAAKKEAKEAEKAIKDAQTRIQKALRSETKPSGTRAKKGERDAQFVDYVKANPGSKLSEISRGIGIASSAANGVAKRVVKEGKVKKAADKTYTAK